MKKVFLLLVALMTLFPVLGNAKGKAQSVSFKYQIPNHQMAVDVQFLTSDIVRVRKWPLALGEAAPQKKSYSVILTPEDRAAQKDAAQAASEGNTMRFTSKSLVVRLNTQTGQLTFQKPDGQTLLTETDTHFKLRHGDADEGKYIVSQAWKLDKEEAIFGLGQLRDGAMNQRGRKVKMWNTNTYTSIPYFTSQKGYGLYWDNAGRSFFEDNEQGTSFLSEVALCTDYYFLYRDGRCHRLHSPAHRAGHPLPVMDHGTLAVPRTLQDQR